VETTEQENYGSTSCCDKIGLLVGNRKGPNESSMPIQIINKKISFHGKAIRKFVKWLNKEYKVQPNIRLEIYPTLVLETEVLDLYKVPYDELQNNFGMYDNITGTILLAVGAVDETLALLHLAHEYRHALQHLNDRRFGEQDADHWAANVLLAYHTDKKV
jgi:hypothetical protein